MRNILARIASFYTSSDLRARVRAWRGRLGLSLADQVFFSGAPFLLNLLIARWLPADAYGALAVAFSVFLVMAGLHAALLTEPMCVLAPGRFHAEQRTYFRHVLRLHVLLSVALSGLVWGVAMAFAGHSPKLAEALSGLALGQPLLLTLWLLRRACYLDARPGLALRGSVVFAALLIPGLFWLREASLLSLFNAFAALGGASLAGSLVLLPALHRTLHDEAPARLTLRALVQEHWQFGRWIAGASLAHSLSHVLLTPLVALLLGLAEAGAFRAVHNLAAPMQQIIAAVGTLLLPWMARRYREGGADVLQMTTRRTALLNTALVVGYGAVLLLFGDVLIAWVYGGAYDPALRGLLLYFVGALLLLAPSQPLALALRAVERPRIILWAKLGAVAAATLVGLPLVWQFGLTGAGLSLIVVALAEAAVLVYAKPFAEVRYAYA